MPEWLVSIPAFVVAIGVLVAVHEFGHYWVARRLGVKVLRYSIGFGSKLCGWTSKKTGTEYWLAAIPLGGYVKMLDEREGEVAPADQPYAFNRQKLWKRVAIVFAGPGINFLFAILAYWLVFMLGVAGIKPIIDTVAAGTTAQVSGLQRGEQIVAVGDKDIPTWQELRLTLLSRALDREPVRLTVLARNGDTRSTILDLTHASPEPDTLFKQLGLVPYQPKGTPVIADTLAGMAAANAGLQAGDKVVTADGKAMDSPSAFVQWIQAHPGEQVNFVIERDGKRLTQKVVLDSKTQDGKTTGQLGAHITVDAAEWEAMRTEQQYNPLAAIPKAVSETWTVSALTVRLLWRMAIGQVSWHNISGPIQIADYAGKTASIGLQAFLSFLALISVSLAVLNLLPVPVLDGGHLLYYAFEFIRGRPLPDQVQAMGQQVGMVALLMLMSLAFYNDILRLFG